MAFVVHSVEGGATFAVRVQPGARLEGVTGLYGEALRIALKAPAVDGKANDALISLMASLLGIPQRSVAILAGQTSRSKVLRVLGITPDEVQAALSISSRC